MLRQSPLALTLALALAPAVGSWTGAEAMPTAGLRVCTMDTELMDVRPLRVGGGPGMDLAVVCGPAGARTLGGHIEIWHDAGDGDFTRTASLTSGDNPDEVTSGDMDGDGDADLVVVNQGQHRRVIAIHENRDGDFADDPVTHDRGGFHTANLVVHDADADGRMDLLLPRGATPRGATLLANTGPEGVGPFQDRALLDHAAEAEGVAVDITGQGMDDLAVPLYSHGKVVLFAGHSDDRLEAVFGKSVRQIETIVGGGDINGDNLPDLAVTTREDPFTVQVRLAVAEQGDDEPIWRMGPIIPDADNPRFVAIRDLTGDGTAEIITVSNVDLTQDRHVARLFHRADDGFEAVGTRDLGGYPSILRTADMDGDGTPELLVGLGDSNRVRIVDGG